MDSDLVAVAIDIPCFRHDRGRELPSFHNLASIAERDVVNAIMGKAAEPLHSHFW